MSEPKNVREVLNDRISRKYGKYGVCVRLCLCVCMCLVIVIRKEEPKSIKVICSYIIVATVTNRICQKTFFKTILSLKHTIHLSLHHFTPFTDKFCQIICVLQIPPNLCTHNHHHQRASIVLVVYVAPQTQLHQNWTCYKQPTFIAFLVYHLIF